MSHDATNWAIKQRGIKPAAKIVLWHLADRYHPDHGCFPSKETLAEDCEMSERSVYDQLKILEEAGLIKIEAGEYQAASGKFKSNHYILCFDKSPSANFAVGKNASSPSANSRKNRRQNLPNNTVSKLSNITCNDHFADFWSAYPRKVSKDGAKRKFSSLSKKNDPLDIISGAKSYAKFVAGKDVQYIKHPTTWLNNGCWKDEITPSQVSENTNKYKSIAAGTA